MGDPHSILVLGEDEPRAAVRSALLSRGYRVTDGTDLRQSMDMLSSGSPDLVLLCPPLRDGPVSDALAELKRYDPKLPIVVAGATGQFDPAQAMLGGAFECVEEPAANKHALLSALGLALGARREDRQLGYLTKRDASGVSIDALVGGDSSMQEAFQRVRQFWARTTRGNTPTILLTGETGTGKGALAKCIHYNGVRRHKPFVEINCASIPSNLVESELFGYERGAFTDAKRGQPGLFETAHAGTLFLDEIGSLPLELQPKLLTAIEEKQVRRIGARQPMRVDVQVIAAAHPTIKAMVKTGAFRPDLYHRLDVLTIKLPPLRERGDDRIRLAEKFLREFCLEYGMPMRRLGDGALSFIRYYSWPGNVRELRNQIERIVLVSDESSIEESHFERASGEFLRVDPMEDGAGFRVTLPPRGLSLPALEREVIKQALDRHDGNVSKTARYLGVSRQTLIYRLKKHGLD